jgi:hypothetical protein
MFRRTSKTALASHILALSVISLASIAPLQAARYPQPSQDQNTTPDSQQPSIADAARRSREHSKNATKPSKVITDDDLDKENVKPGQQGLTVDGPPKLETQPPTQDAVAEAQVDVSQNVDPATAPEASDDPEIKKLKEQIAEAEKDVDILKRDLALKQDTYFSNPDYIHDKDGKAALDAQQQQINDQQQNIDGLKARLAALEEKQRVHPPKPAKKPPQPVKP